MESTWHAYPATYSDGHGTEHTLIFNDGETIGLEIRGVRFSGRDFDGLSPSHEAPLTSLAKFTLNKQELCDCTIACEMPLVISSSPSPPGHYLGKLHVELRLGKPAPNGGIDLEILKLSLSYGEWCFISHGSGALFETELLDLKRQLPAGHYFSNCFGCSYSDYFYGGQGLFGSMVCFRESKAEYRSIKTKEEYIAVFEKNAGAVQETHICPEFLPRGPNTGYRG